ncbi:uncharacterized protein PV06_07022 [Exophiala oligosperma]|uniref:3-hydroxyacyl-CoA dehydrogenase n=1 Tax=Exophiala oligosperma TaxID=215243 RepID=A0A0D2BVJ4_9EURO|nr:uncharacterized protein PV06_07022 [Exophiala oligosperma]KIW41467.1 hypothetical protein PV06_07022 [Exophiala oligosperma]
MDKTRKAVTILGGGTQGTRLAFMWTRKGRPVYLVDQNEQQLLRARKGIDDLRSQLQSLWATSTHWGEVITTPPKELEQAASKSWLVLECVPESLKLKRSVVQELDQISSPETIVASNSSSYTIEEILEGQKLKYDDRFASLHSYWPPETSAIEVMGSSQTRPEIITRLMEETKKHGFSPFHVRKTSTGYIYNRIWAAIKREALLTLSEGVATPEEIDAIFKDVLKTPKGPCEQMDVVGLDVVRDIEQHYADVRTGIPEQPRTYLQGMIDQGRLGVKSGSGFYHYGDKK